MTIEQLARLGNAAANVEKAIEDSPELLRGHPGGAAAAVGDALRLALALKGFIVVDTPEGAKSAIAEMEATEAMVRLGPSVN